MSDQDLPDESASTDDEAIESLVRRLSRPHRSGGAVVERAAIMADGADSSAVLAWIYAHDGEPEALTPASTGQGLHGARFSGADRVPLRFVLPPGAFD